MNTEIFRAYDVRGIYPKDINEDIAYDIAKAYSYVFRPFTVAVGCDARLTSPIIKRRLIDGLLENGVNVVDIGNIISDMLYFTVGKYGYDGGITVSASHNPSEYNGLKFVKRDAAAISSDTGLYDIRNALIDGSYKSFTSKNRGEISKKTIIDDYINHVFKVANVNKIDHYRFVANANFGLVSTPLNIIIKKLGLEIIPLNYEPDGSFPKGPPDPMSENNRIETQQLIKKEKADFGVAWDGDADRAMFFDQYGNFIPGVYITALLSEIILKKYGTNNKIVFDPRVIWPVRDTIERLGGTSIMCKSGHAFMKDRMRTENAIFGGELSGHYFFKDNYYADNGLVPFLLILKELSIRKTNIFEIVKQFMQNHYMSGEINYRVKNIPAILNTIENKYGTSGTNDFIDGFSVENLDWRFNVRPSNTEPLIRLNVEARKKETMETMRDKLIDIITSYQ